MNDYKYHLGIDLHRRTSFWTLMDDERNILWKKNIETSKKAIEDSLENIGIAAKDIHCAIEPVSGWGWYGDILEEKGIKVNLVDVYKSKLIAGTKLKNDKVDSKILAEMLRSDFLPTAYYAPKETRDLREFVRSRAFLVRLRTRIRNRIHMMLQKQGIIFAYCRTRQRVSPKSHRIARIKNTHEHSRHRSHHRAHHDGGDRRLQKILSSKQAGFIRGFGCFVIFLWGYE